MLKCMFSNEHAMMEMTPVENIFIAEYMPKAPDDSVKVYLYGLMLCRNPYMDAEDIQLALGRAGGDRSVFLLGKAGPYTRGRGRSGSNKVFNAKAACRFQRSVASDGICGACGRAQLGIYGENAQQHGA